ncbi:MAG: sugar ABC transporter permease [Actinobacteria bacterium]|nr:sugar ABC transporter permease [Actinomycetota bacterium]
MTTLEQAEATARARTVAKARRPRRRIGDDWWRYLVGLLAIAFALFPLLYVVSAAFNPIDSLTGASLIPDSVTLDNFRQILSGTPGEEGTSEAALDVPYVSWYLNMLLISGVTAVLSVFFAALAAYAFARYRFRGRKLGMLGLLLIQMFPTFLAVVAIYFIVLRVGDVFPAMGLDTRLGVILVYLGGALGVNTWLMKGFLDSIPDELDESARVDGATPAQVFWAIILPLAAPVLAVVGLLSYIGTINEFIIASTLLQTTDKFTLTVGLFGFIQDKYAQQWGPFCAGVVLAAIPVVVLFFFLQRFIVHGLVRGAVKG